MRIVIALLFLFNTAGAARAGDQKTIIWPYFSFPPLVIIGPNGQLSGVSVEMQAMLMRALPEYRHDRINSPINRSMLAVSEGQNYCLTGLLKRPDRERLLEYSIPCRLVPPQVVVTMRGMLDRHKSADGQVSLKELVEDGRLTNGHIKGISHGAVLDGIIEANLWRENIFEIIDMKSLERQVDLLLSGRIQYFVTPPDQAWHALKNQGLEGRLEMLRISEADWGLGYVACTRGEWGGDVIRRINNTLAGELRGERLKALYRDRLPPAFHAEFDDAWERLVGPFAAGPKHGR